MIGGDTSFLIDFFKGEKGAVEWMDENKEALHLCENVVYEFLSGNLTDKEKQKFLGFVSQFPVHSFDRDAALESSEIFRSGKKRGETVPHPDAMIAGIYSSRNVEKIITKNPDHFKHAGGIEVIEYDKGTG